MACDTLFKDHMYTCQWSDTGPLGPLVFSLLFSFFNHYFFQMNTKWFVYSDKYLVFVFLFDEVGTQSHLLIDLA